MTIAPHRIGAPQPLAQHIGQMLASYQAALTGAAAAEHPDFPWDPALDVFDLRPPDPVYLAAEIAQRMSDTLAGLERWQAHPYFRPANKAPTLWQAGSSRLLDYSTPETPKNAPKVLVLPSLVNRAYVLDLLPGHSAMVRLSDAGLRPYLLDWGAPGIDEAGFGIDDYVARALGVMEQLGPTHLLGYCMGGTLAAGIAARHPALVRSLVTLGAPWDFHADGGSRAQLRLIFGQNNGFTADTMLATLARDYGHIPAAVFQSLFALLNPLAFARKFRRFAAMPADEPAALLFVALEDWLADGIAMSAPAARSLLLDWHLHSQPAKGEWLLGGQPVLATDIRCPTLVIAGQHDNIAPAPSALALAANLPRAQRRTAPTGHVGLITSAQSAPKIWDDIALFIRDT